jgi:steroid 5-alpha reductase family enzyme
MGPGMLLSGGTAIGLTALGAGLVFALAWVRQLRTRDATSVDLLWTLGIGAAAVFHAATSDGWVPRRALVALLAGLWSARLAAHLAQRLGQGEDGRYSDLRRRLGPRAAIWFLGFYLAQAALVVGFGLVFRVLARGEHVGWRASDALALGVFALALLGESAADRALARWRAAPENRGRTCRAGLWRYSRHPNYFFEWLHWLSYPLLGLGLAYGGWLWLAPAVMFALVRFVTGVPPSEARALASRGDDYRAYQRSTNTFFPGPPRAELRATVPSR